jgi:hypothetical protein
MCEITLLLPCKWATSPPADELTDIDRRICDADHERLSEGRAKYRHFINGQGRFHGQGVIDVENPATGAIIARCRTAALTIADQATAATRRSPANRRLPWLAASLPDLARLILKTGGSRACHRRAGKPLQEARGDQAPRST